GPDLGPGACPPREGVVFRYAAVGMEADDLALELVEVLCGGALVVVAQRNEKMACAIEHQPDTEMMPGGKLGLLSEQHLEVLQACMVGAQSAASDRRAGLAVRASFGITEVDEP